MSLEYPKDNIWSPNTYRFELSPSWLRVNKSLLTTNSNQ